MTDHYARAVKTLQAVLDYAETDENTDALVSIIAAQVHAILHLAEQQRNADRCQYRRERKSGMKTPTTDGGLRKYDDLPPADAAVRAWVTPGVRPEWDARAKQSVRDACPLLARALDRMVEEGATGR